MPSDANCENCRVEKFLVDAHRILPRMVITTQIEDTTRTLYCLGCKHYLFEVDNFKAVD